jgi:ElaB/YqjD/DUF883 family membrane-anchored ribosome-binding protein
MRVPINRLEPIWPKSLRDEATHAREHGSWGDTAKTFEHRIEDMLAEHPKVAIGAAAVLGVVLGWMVKRR